MLIKTVRLIIVLSASIFLIFASYRMLFAKDEPVPPTPLLFEKVTPEGTSTFYELDYFLPYAKRITTSYSYINGGGLMAFTWSEQIRGQGVHASYSYLNADQINDLQVIVTLHDGREFTLTPHRIKLNHQWLPVLQQNGLPNNEFPNPPEVTITLVEGRIDIDARIRDFDWMRIQLFASDAMFYEVNTIVDYIESVPTTEVFDHAVGYMWYEDTLEIEFIKFNVIHAEVVE